jgi:hypothetical protein
VLSISVRYFGGENKGKLLYGIKLLLHVLALNGEMLFCLFWYLDSQVWIWNADYVSSQKELFSVRFGLILSSHLSFLVKSYLSSRKRNSVTFDLRWFDFALAGVVKSKQ